MNIIQKTSPNFDKGRNGVKIDRIVMHWIVGDLSAADAIFLKDSSDVSAHYAVGTSEIHQYVKEEDTAWHAGVYAMNQRSIGIEHRGGPSLPIDEGTYKNSAELIAYLTKKYSIPLDREHIIKHKEVPYATQCCGTLDVDRIIKMAKELNNPTSLKDTKIDFLDFEGHQHEVGWYVHEWEVEKKTNDRLSKEIAQKNADYERLQKTNSDQTLTISQLQKSNEQLTEDKAQLEVKVETLTLQLKELENTYAKSLEGISKQLAESYQAQDVLKEKLKQGIKAYSRWQLFISFFSRR